MSMYVVFVIGLTLGAGVAVMAMSLAIIAGLGEEDLPPQPPRSYQD